MENLDILWKDFIEMTKDTMEWCDCTAAESLPYMARKRVNLDGKEVILQMDIKVVG